MRAFSANMLDRLYGWPGLLLMFTTMFWAGNAVAGQLAKGEVSPPMLVFLRWVIVAAVMWPIYGAEIRAHWPAIRPRLGAIIAMAALGFTGFNTLFYLAAYHTTAVNIGILQGSMPIFVLAGAFVAHGSRASLIQLCGVLLTAVGVVVVATKGAPLAVFYLGLNWGDLVMLAACVLYSFYAVALQNRPAMPGAAFFTLLALIAAVAALPLVVLEATTQGLQVPTFDGMLVTAYVAIFPSCLAQLFFLRGVDLIGPGRAGVYINLVPVFAALLAVVVINETFALFHAIALVLVLSGIWLAQRKPKLERIRA